MLRRECVTIHDIKKTCQLTLATLTMCAILSIFVDEVLHALHAIQYAFSLPHGVHRSKAIMGTVVLLNLTWLMITILRTAYNGFPQDEESDHDLENPAHQSSRRSLHESTQEGGTVHKLVRNSDGRLAIVDHTNHEKERTGDPEPERFNLAHFQEHCRFRLGWKGFQIDEVPELHKRP